MTNRISKAALLAAIALAAGLPSAARAQVLYTTDFNSPTYSNGGLIGQDGWLITGASVVSPITVANTGTNGNVALTTTGQDVNRPFLPAVTSASVWLTVDVTLSAAQATGDYFIHLGDGGASNFYSRIYARSATTGFVLAMTTSSIVGAPTYGATELAFGTTYRLLARYDMVAGATNDTGALFVNPADPFGVGDIAYVAATMAGTDATTISSVNLRQGTAGNAPTLVLDNITVAVPAPATLPLLALAGIAVRRRRR